jgi:hypothetical protein
MVNRICSFLVFQFPECTSLNHDVHSENQKLKSQTAIWRRAGERHTYSRGFVLPGRAGSAGSLA